MAKTDYYEVLNLTPACTPQEIKQSYRKLALKWHPDKCNASDKHRFHEIQEAYTVLSDVREKELYDKFGFEGLGRDETPLSNTRKSFFEKGFFGTDKSAFDILQEILREENDCTSTVFDHFEHFESSETPTSHIKRFLSDDLFEESQKEKGKGKGFFETYVPTFNDPDFCLEKPSFMNKKTEEESSTQYFSSLFTTDSSDDQAYFKTSATVRQQNGKFMASTQEVFQNENGFYETINKTEYEQGESLPRNCRFEHFISQTFESTSFVFLDEAMEEFDFDFFENSNNDQSFGCESSYVKFDKWFQEDSNLVRDSRKITKTKEPFRARYVNRKQNKKTKG